MWPRTPRTFKTVARTARLGFTLIEVLVVVAIIALLIIILIPSLSLAREQAKRAVCLSNLRQMGVSLSGYSADHRSLLPWAGSFRWSLLEGAYYLLDAGGDFLSQATPEDWIPVNHGVLYPRYVNKTPDIFYCPSNTTFSIDSPNGKARLLRVYNNPKKGDPAYLNAHNYPISPFSSYVYGIPAKVTGFPRDAGAKMYPPEVVQSDPDDNWQNPYWTYLNDPAEPDPSFLGPFPQESRGKHSIHALMSDAYFAPDHVEGYHMGGYNVMFGDFHARWIRDPGGRIHAADISLLRYQSGGYSDINSAKLWMVWDYWSRQP